MFKFRSLINHLAQKSFNIRTVTILQNGNGKTINETLCSAIRVDLENPNSPVPFCEVNKTNLKNYQFPILKISYNQNDVVEHAKSVGIDYGAKYRDLYLDKRNPNLRVLPSFIFPFTNKILLDMSLSNQTGWMKFDQTVHGEHYIRQIRQLPTKGKIYLEIKTLDVLDKGKGTLYCFSMNGYNRKGEIYFQTEYQMFEIGTGEFNGNKCNPYLTRIAEQNKDSEPDSVLQFSTIVPEGGYKSKLSDSDLNEISIYSPRHPRQHYSNQYAFLPKPVAHGRYTFAGVINLVLFKYGHGTVEKFKSAKVRFAEPVFLGDNIRVSTWKKGSKIIFQGSVHKNGKTTRVLSGGYIDLES